MPPKGGNISKLRLSKHRPASQGQRDMEPPLLVPDYLCRTGLEQAKATGKGICPPWMTGNLQKHLRIIKSSLNKTFCPPRTQEGYEHWYDPCEEEKRGGWKWKRQNHCQKISAGFWFSQVYTAISQSHRSQQLSEARKLTLLKIYI